MSLLVYFSGRGPAKTANCKPNEVEVPNVVGWQRRRRARAARGAAADAAGDLQAGDAPGSASASCSRQFPRSGTLSSFDTVTLVLAKPLHGTVPKIVGLNLRQARAKLRKLKLQRRRSRFGDGKAGRVVAQEPRAGVAAAPGMTVTLRVGTAG